MILIRSLHFTTLATCAAITACAPPPGISARMSDAEVRTILTRETPPGSTEADVSQTMNRLGAPANNRFAYDQTADRPRVLLQRLYESTWLSRGGDDDLKYLDISFVFSPTGALDRTVLLRDKVRFFQGEAIIYPHAPKRKLQQHPGRFIGSLPPPIDPLEGGE